MIAQKEHGLQEVLLEGSSELTFPSVLTPIVKSIGIVYTVSLEKTGCKDCRRYQSVEKSVIDRLGRRKTKYDDAFEFHDIVVSPTDSDFGKRIFRVTAYPTVMTLVVDSPKEGRNYISETSRLTEVIPERTLLYNIDYANLLARRIEERIRARSSL